MYILIFVIFVSNRPVSVEGALVGMYLCFGEALWLSESLLSDLFRDDIVVQRSVKQNENVLDFTGDGKRKAGRSETREENILCTVKRKIQPKSPLNPSLSSSSACGCAYSFRASSPTHSYYHSIASYKDLASLLSHYPSWYVFIGIQLI